MTDQEPQSFPFDSAELLRVRCPPRRPWWKRALLLLFALCGAALLFIPGVAVKLVAAVVLLAVLWFYVEPATLARSHVRAGKGGVEIDGILLPRARIKDALLLRDPLCVHVRQRSGLTLDVHVGSVKEGRALLRALGLDVSQTVAEFATSAPSGWEGLGSVLSAAALFFALSTLLDILRVPHASVLTGAMIGGLSPALYSLWSTKIRVGMEGIEIRWLWTRRFLRYEEIDHLERVHRTAQGTDDVLAIGIVLSSGERIRLPGEAGVLKLLEARIREASKRPRKGDAAAVSALLQRGDRSVDAWASALRALGAGANAGPRTAPVPRERLFRVVEDPSLPARDRAAAAVALGIDLDEEDRARLRTAAGATAMPRLRIAIEAAASGADEAKVEAALAEIEEGEASAQRARR